MEGRLEEGEEEEHASLALKGMEKGQRWHRPVKPPALSLTADPGQELLQNVSALSPWLIDLNDCLASTQCTAGWKRSNAEKWNMPSVHSLWSWAFFCGQRCGNATARTVVIGVFQQRYNNSENCCGATVFLFLKCLVSGAFCWTSSLRFCGF